MKAIHQLSREYGFTVVEDASHCIGAEYDKTKRLDRVLFQTWRFFSFHPVKIITTGEGGMVLTNRKDLYDKLIRLRNPRDYERSFFFL